MAKLSRNQARNLVDRYFLVEGWYPAASTAGQRLDHRLGDLGMDDPPLEGDPHAQKQRIALDLQRLFFMLGSRLATPLPELKKKSVTVTGHP